MLPKLTLSFALLVGGMVPLDAGPSSGFLNPAGGGATFAGPERRVLATAGADFAQRDFQAEITVTLKGGGGPGIAFFGLGKGQPNPQSYHEPTLSPSLVFRFCPSDFAGGLAAAFVDGKPSGQTIPLGDGTHRLRLTWQTATKRAWLGIHPNWRTGAAFEATSTLFVGPVDLRFGNDGRIFVGGGGGVVFSDFSIRDVSQAELAALPVPDVFTNDPTAGTWLPRPGATVAPNDPALASFLSSIACHMRTLACWYDGSRLTATRPFAGDRLKTAASEWSQSVKATPVGGDSTALDLELTFRLTAGSAPAAGVAVAFDVANWSPDNYVMVPASVYDGNRCRIVGRGYATGLDRTDLYRKDLPLTSCAIPQLSPEPGKVSKFEISSCNATTPAICLFSPKAKRGFIILAEQGLHVGDRVIDHGFAVEENADRSAATLVISAPGVRERKPEFIGFSASPDRGMNLKTGDEIKLKLRLYSFAAADVPALLENFMTVRKAITGPNAPRNLLPASKVVDIMTGRIDGRFHNGKDFKFYCPENAAWISFGWIGGLMDTFPMLALGDETHLDRVTRTFDFAIPRAQGRAGYYYGALNQDGKCFGREGYDEHPEISLTRKNGDVLFWMLKQFLLLKAQGRAGAVKPAWEESMKKLADAFVATWKKDGQWGNFVNIDSGAVAVYNTTGGASAIGGLALASQYYHQPEYLRIAQAAAELYYQRDFVAHGQTTGACADILQNADSETAAGFMTALMTLHEITGDARWLEESRNLANLAATWTVSYDYELPPQCELRSLGAKLAGVVWASTQNKHGAPGICTSSGDALFKIFRATGDRRYADLIRDIIHAHAEGIQPNGQITERLTYCDADSRGSRGSGTTGWNELNGILMAMEIPGIYLRTDRQDVYVFDSVSASVVKAGVAGVALELTNPTAHDASVSIFAEAAAQAAKPLGCTGFIAWPKVAVKAGTTIRVAVAPDGSVK